MTSKQKNRVLVAGFVILLLTAYQFSFKKTFEIKAQINKQLAEKKEVENATERIQFLQVENANLNAILESNDVSADQSFEQNLLQKIDRIRREHKVKIVLFEQFHQYISEEASTVSYMIEVQGDFRNLMFFSSDLEKQRLGKFASVSFATKKNPKTRKNELICKIILQKLSK
ncbi:hypothetical protein AAON49_05145 [Pseudotenacibaculum sp. MALMAid0570]|uniref:hypothetical protein n=1 Tax=Pseudotenacibaculum sp. MALMAid0570 TaxID=3143938 RepID=UPI0032DFFDE9